MTACWPLQGMSPAQKSVLISLADNANDDGVCWPSVATIGARTCLSERAVRNALRWLEEVGILKSNQRFGRSTWYSLTPAAYAPGTTCPPAPDAPSPRQEMPPTPAPGAPRTVKEPSIEPSQGGNRVSRSPSCPVQDIVDLFNRLLTPALPAVVLLSEARKKQLRARWRQSVVHQSLDFWTEYFASVAESDFLMGRSTGKAGGAPFRATFDWLIAPSNFVKVVEGNYHA
ncbi:helix-turn-helix domain-containing protein [Pseudomonas plecoglossicida]|nr:helix-turn-helix domain-containing protein [Pseudomonas plecoglossicida]MBA1321210.1 helix-turn-helix domain-containing protein [Pseudomonas plecoglossicida]